MKSTPTNAAPTNLTTRKSTLTMYDRLMYTQCPVILEVQLTHFTLSVDYA